MLIRRSIALVLTALLSLGAAHGQEAPSAAAEIPPALLAQMQTIETATSILRDLPETAPIERAFPTRAQTIAYLEDLYNRELPQDEIDRTTDFYVALGLLPADIDLRQVYLDLLGSQVAGFYDTDTRTMNVIPLTGDDPGQRLSLLEQTIYAHEYTHALQDMHFDLDAVLPDTVGREAPDRALALIALIEGDATAVMQVYLQEAAADSPAAALSLLAETALAGALTMPSGIPDILTRELLFPYEAGLTFVSTVWSDGGWEAVNAAYTTPPTTSEQIIHPQKFLDGEGAIAVDLGDATPGESWMLVWDTTLGQFYLREHLRTVTEFDTAAARASIGWGGDALRVWRADDGGRAFALRLAFDTPADLDEFVAVYDEATGAFAESCGVLVESVLCAVRDGDQIVIASAPDIETARLLIGA